jgi:hypothetical protein
MGEHRTPASKAIIDSLVTLGTAFGYHGVREWELPNTGPHPEQVDIALFANARSLQPAFIIEVDSSDGAAATSNAVKVFWQADKSSDKAVLSLSCVPEDRC